MEIKRNVLQWLADGADLPHEQIPGQFLLEILGEDRVLIENHRGIREYGMDRIGVKSSFGYVTIYGKALELCHMSKERLIIRGRINCVALYRRKC